MKRLVFAATLASILSSTAFAQQRMGPPQEAYDACSGSSTGSSCSFETPRGTLEGTCGTIPEDDTQVVCMPSRGGRGGNGMQGGPGQMGMGGNGIQGGPGQMGMGGDMGERRGPPPEAFSACENSSVGDACSFSGRNDNEVSGSCRQHNGQLACAPSMGRPTVQ